ncbi:MULTISPECIES: hypothetical protein [unclassified Pantoea]|uniref:hypothetical protein n=1 Tax=unclassified Pantoea TaxID=2630326 RepID=UPI000DE25382|nr:MULTISPECIES: hypothetical protein [unclassified Pantoea]MCG7368727.1 hypothetical protein [Pantoea sp. ACRSH]MCG7399119.1 hypothetical protein [Pantoea sp. ACRSC]RBO11124.1 hypothetical protein DSL62_19070 [Pantoea sp. 3_1284]
MANQYEDRDDLAQPAPQTRDSKDYLRNMAAIDNDHRRTPEQKLKAKQLLTASAFQRNRS